jgi:hypothetical protein
LWYRIHNATLEWFEPRRRKEVPELEESSCARKKSGSLSQPFEREEDGESNSSDLEDETEDSSLSYNPNDEYTRQKKTQPLPARVVPPKTSGSTNLGIDGGTPKRKGGAVKGDSTFLAFTKHNLELSS